MMGLPSTAYIFDRFIGEVLTERLGFFLVGVTGAACR